MEMKAKIGDTVHVKGTILGESSGLKYPVVRFALASGAGGDVCVCDDDIVHVEPAPLKVGDRVNCGKDWTGYTIIALYTVPNGTALAWIRDERDDGKAGFIASISNLERADEPRQLKVGDKVYHKRDNWSGTVEICNPRCDTAHVRLGNGQLWQTIKSGLERVE
jgi:hypothetical protein